MLIINHASAHQTASSRSAWRDCVTFPNSISRLTGSIFRRSILLTLLFLPLGVWADGMVFPTIAYPARVTIPDQQAALSFSNGVERLVIETRFAGAGSNFAWVVPLPSQPVIEAATPGFFPTLRFLCRPEVLHEVPRYFAGILALIGILTLVCTVRYSGRIQWLDIVACLGVGVAAAGMAATSARRAGPASRAARSTSRSSRS